MATKLKAARIRNFRGLSFLDLSPTETVVKMTAGNGQNKSNALKAILAAIEPGAIDGEPIKYGENEASSEIDLALEDGGTLTIARRWYVTKSGARKTEVAITRVNGEDVSTYDAKRVLPKLLGPFANVRQFLDVRTPSQERELADALLKSAGVDVAEADSAIEAATTARRDAKAALASAEARLSGIATPQPGLPAEEVSVAGRAAEIAAWREQARAHERATMVFEDARYQSARVAAEIARLERELAAAKAAHEKAREVVDREKAALAAMPAPPSSDAIAEAEASMGTLEATNAAIRQAAAWRELAAEVAGLRTTAAKAEADVSAARSAKLAMLAGAKLPIDGLAVTEDGAVTFDGVGLHELSEGQKLVVGCAIAIATRGSLSAIFVDGAESIDAANEARAAAMCEAAGVTLILTETTKSASALVIRGAQWSREEAA